MNIPFAAGVEGTGQMVSGNANGGVPAVATNAATNAAIIADLEKTKSKHVTASFYLNASHPIVGCPDVIGAIFDEKGNERRGNKDLTISRGELIPLYIRSLKLFANTSRSQVYDVELLRDNIVVKTSHGEEYDVEFAIGYYFLNPLRAEIPNFVQTYERFSCGSSEGVCGTGRVSKFLATEKVKGVTVEKFVKGLPYNDICLLLLQVYLSLIIANKRFEFCHLDLHDGNVMVYDVEPTTITYNVSFQGREESIELTVPFIAVIIDFGFSRVVHEGKVLTANNVSKPGNRSYADFYAFLEACIVVNRGKDVENALDELLAMLPNMYSYPNIVGTDFSEAIIRRLLTECTRYEAVKVYTPDTCARKGRTSPITSTLDYYEGYPLSRMRKVNVDKILDLAIQQLGEENKMRRFMTYCKLYVFFFEKHRDRSTKVEHGEWYDRCLFYLKQQP